MKGMENMKKENKKKELKENYKLLFNTIIILLDYFTINILVNYIDEFGAVDGVYSLGYAFLIVLMVISSSILLKRINYTRK